MLSGHVLIGVGNGCSDCSVNLGPRYPGFQIDSGRGKGCKDAGSPPTAKADAHQNRLSSGHSVPPNSGGHLCMVLVYSSLYVSLNFIEASAYRSRPKDILT
jgi:hypothetical protein